MNPKPGQVEGVRYCRVIHIPKLLLVILQGLVVMQQEMEDQKINIQEANDCHWQFFKICF